MTIEILKEKDGAHGGFCFLAILEVGGGGVVLRDPDLDSLEKRLRQAIRDEGVRLPALP